MKQNSKILIGQSVITIKNSASLQVAFLRLNFISMQDMGLTGLQTGAQTVQ